MKLFFTFIYMYKEIPPYICALYFGALVLSKSNKYDELEDFFIDMSENEISSFIDLLNFKN